MTYKGISEIPLFDLILAKMGCPLFGVTTVISKKNLETDFQQKTIQSCLIWATTIFQKWEIREFLKVPLFVLFFSKIFIPLFGVSTVT